MVDAWPIDLPQYVLVDGYSEQSADNIIETEPDIGPPISRRRSTSAAREMTVSYELTKAQLASLRAFYEATLLSGSLPFSFAAPSENTTYLLKFKKGGGPRWVGMGGRYFKVTMSFLVLP